MESSISSFCKTLGSFCNHLQSSCDALKQSVERRPIPLDSASSTFIQCLNRRVSSVSSDLNVLESMVFETVSFEELLGHCNEVFKKNESDMLELLDRLRSFGYVSEEVPGLVTSVALDSDLSESQVISDSPSSISGMTSAADSIMKKLEEDPLFDESMSLQTLGLSDVCLATLASEADGNVSSRKQIKHCKDILIGKEKLASKMSGMTQGEVGNDLMPVHAPPPLISISKEDYEALPSYLKSLASWEDVLHAVDKMNSNLAKREKTEGGSCFHQEELSSLNLGPKGRSYLLLLLRMNRMVVETIDGSISYRVL